MTIRQPWPRSAAQDAAAYAPCNVVNETAMTCWLAAHAEMVDHWETVHPNDVVIPWPCCLPLVREEALRFARVEQMYPYELSTALEAWGA
jgi:hypothetical protein